jgi:hypothetical protein
MFLNGGCARQNSQHSRAKTKPHPTAQRAANGGSMNTQYPPNVADQIYLINLPDDGWATHELPGNWQVRISQDGNVVAQNPDKEGNFRWFANVHSPVTISEASLFPQQLQVERHTVDPDFSVFANGDNKVAQNRKLTCGPVQPIFGKFGGRWHVLIEENWRLGVLFTINDQNDVTAMHLTAFKMREVSRRSLDAFKKETSFSEKSFERLNVNQFLANNARNFGLRSLHVLRFRDQTMAKPLELPWSNTTWMPVASFAYEQTAWTEIPVSDSEVQIVPTQVLGTSYDIFGGYALWQIVSQGYLPGISVYELLS